MKSQHGSQLCSPVQSNETSTPWELQHQAGAEIERSALISATDHLCDHKNPFSPTCLRNKDKIVLPVHCFAKACWLWSRARPYIPDSFHVGHRSLIKQEQHPPSRGLEGQNLCVLLPVAGTISLCSLVVLCVSMVKRNPSPHRFKTFCMQTYSEGPSNQSQRKTKCYFMPWVGN